MTSGRPGQGTRFVKGTFSRLTRLAGMLRTPASSGGRTRTLLPAKATPGDGSQWLDSRGRGESVTLRLSYVYDTVDQ